MTDEITCPAEGCDRTDESKETIVRHYNAMRDDAHPGGHPDSSEVLSGQLSDARKHSPIWQTAVEQSSQPSQSGGDDNPTVGGGDSGGGRDGQDMDPAGGERYELPCGHETFAWSDVPDSAIKQENGTKYTYVACDDCDGEWMVTDE